jgi:hypothetical protein
MSKSEIVDSKYQQANSFLLKHGAKEGLDNYIVSALVKTKKCRLDFVQRLQKTNAIDPLQKLIIVFSLSSQSQKLQDLLYSQEIDLLFKFDKWDLLSLSSTFKSESIKHMILKNIYYQAATEGSVEWLKKVFSVSKYIKNIKIQGITVLEHLVANPTDNTDAIKYLFEKGVFISKALIGSCFQLLAQRFVKALEKDDTQEMRELHALGVNPDYITVELDGKKLPLLLHAILYKVMPETLSTLAALSQENGPYLLYYLHEATKRAILNHDDDLIAYFLETKAPIPSEIPVQSDNESGFAYQNTVEWMLCASANDFKYNAEFIFPFIALQGGLTTNAAIMIKYIIEKHAQLELTQDAGFHNKEKLDWQEILDFYAKSEQGDIIPEGAFADSDIIGQAEEN